MKPAFQCVRTRWIPGFMPSAGLGRMAGHEPGPFGPMVGYWRGAGWLAAGTSGAG